MNILNDKLDSHLLSKTNTEKVQQEKQEYKLIDTYSRTPGLNLYCFDPFNLILSQIDTIVSGKAILVIKDGIPTVEDYVHKSIVIDPRFHYFEALNFISARKRVELWQSGKKELSNFKKKSNNKIKLW